jgi:hypothetical protein
MRAITMQAIVVISLGVVLAMILWMPPVMLVANLGSPGPCNPASFPDDAHISALCEGATSDAYIFVPLRTEVDRRLQTKYATAAIAGFGSLFFVLAFYRRRKNRFA